jgi:hypothetical protein
LASLVRKPSEAKSHRESFLLSAAIRQTRTAELDIEEALVARAGPFSPRSLGAQRTFAPVIEFKAEE